MNFMNGGDINLGGIDISAELDIINNDSNENFNFDEEDIKVSQRIDKDSIKSRFSVGNKSLDFGLKTESTKVEEVVEVKNEIEEVYTEQTETTESIEEDNDDFDGDEEELSEEELSEEELAELTGKATVQTEIASSVKINNSDNDDDDWDDEDEEELSEEELEAEYQASLTAQSQVKQAPVITNASDDDWDDWDDLDEDEDELSEEELQSVATVATPQVEEDDEWGDFEEDETEEELEIVREEVKAEPIVKEDIQEVKEQVAEAKEQVAEKQEVKTVEKEVYKQETIVVRQDSSEELKKALEIIDKLTDSHNQLKNTVDDLKAGKVKGSAEVKSTNLNNKQQDKVKNNSDIIRVKNIKTYSEMTDESLYNHIKTFLIKSGVSKAPVDLKICIDKFGKDNIRKMLDKSYIVKIGNGVTIGR